MLNHFWQKIPAFQNINRPKPITRHDPNVFHPAAVCVGQMRAMRDAKAILTEGRRARELRDVAATTL